MKRILYSLLIGSFFIGCTLQAEEAHESLASLKQYLAELAFSIHQKTVTLKEVQEQLGKAQELVAELIKNNGQESLDALKKDDEAKDS